MAGSGDYRWIVVDLAPGRVIVERRKINLFPVFPLDIKIARVVVSEIWEVFELARVVIAGSG